MTPADRVMSQGCCILLFLFSSVSSNLMAGNVIIEMQDCKLDRAEKQEIIRLSLPEPLQKALAVPLENQPEPGRCCQYNPPENRDFWEAIAHLRNFLKEAHPQESLHLLPFFAGAEKSLIAIILEYCGYPPNPWIDAALSDLPKPSHRQPSYHSPFGHPDFLVLRLYFATLMFIANEIQHKRYINIDEFNEIIKKISPFFILNSSYVKNNLEPIQTANEEGRFEDVPLLIAKAMSERLPALVHETNINLSKKAKAQFLTPKSIFRLPGATSQAEHKEQTFKLQKTASSLFIKIGAASMVAALIGIEYAAFSFQDEIFNTTASSRGENSTATAGQLTAIISFFSFFCCSLCMFGILALDCICVECCLVDRLR